MIREEYSDFGLLYDQSHMPLLYETPDAALGVLKESPRAHSLGQCGAGTSNAGLWGFAPALRLAGRGE